MKYKAGLSLLSVLTFASGALGIVVLLGGCQKREQPQESVAVPPGAPSCVFRVAARNNWTDRTQLLATMKGFALSHHFRECPVPHYQDYSGPGYPEALYKDQQFAIWAWAQDRFPNCHVAAYTTNYSLRDFQALTNSLAVVLQKAFPRHVEVSPALLRENR